MTSAADQTPGYLFDNAGAEAANQLRILAQILDRHSTGALRDVGLAPGQRWLDAGAGLGSISHFLSDAVGPDGHVTAVDLDPRHIGSAKNLTVLASDIRDVDLPPASFDGIHVRLLTMHLPHPQGLLARLSHALAADGVLVVSEWDCEWRDLVRDSPDADSAALFAKFLDISLGIGQRAGIDLGWAKRVYAAVAKLDFVDVHTRTESSTWSGGTGFCLLHRSNSLARADLLLQAGFTVEELDRFRALMLDPRMVLSSYLMHTTVARRA